MEPIEGVDLKELVEQCKVELKEESKERERFNGMTIKEMIDDYKNDRRPRSWIK